jgi:hypothetical protein
MRKHVHSNWLRARMIGFCSSCRAQAEMMADQRADIRPRRSRVQATRIVKAKAMNVRKNIINVIQPYWHAGMWVFDDPRVGLSREPFVGGADTMIDRVTAEIPNARTGFTMVFSAIPFPDHQFRLEWAARLGLEKHLFTRRFSTPRAGFARRSSDMSVSMCGPYKA